MPNDMPVYNTLTTDETRVVQAMRRFLAHGEDGGVRPGGADEPLVARVEVPLRRFLALLWRSDPFVVRLNLPFDPEVTPFELQLLYAVAVARAGNAATVEELLGWWFPPDRVARGRAALETAARVLEDIGMRRQSPARLREHILSVSSQRVRQRLHVVTGGRSASAGYRHRPRPTLH